MYFQVANCISQKMQLFVALAPKDNRISKRDFGLLDFHLRSKPNISVGAAESRILLLHNRTVYWGFELPYDNRNEYLESAKKVPKDGGMWVLKATRCHR